MKWTVNNGLKCFEINPDVAFEYYLQREFSEMLETALDFFLTSSWTYNDLDGNHIGWLVSNMVGE